MKSAKGGTPRVIPEPSVRSASSLIRQRFPLGAWGVPRASHTPRTRGFGGCPMVPPGALGRWGPQGTPEILQNQWKFNEIGQGGEPTRGAQGTMKPYECLWIPKPPVRSASSLIRQRVPLGARGSGKPYPRTRSFGECPRVPQGSPREPRVAE